MFINNAFAQATNAVSQPANNGIISSLIYFFVIIAVFYFILIRPQQKKFNEQKKLINSIKRGDEVITIGGIIGKVVRVKEHNELILEIAPEVRISILKSAVSSILTSSSEEEKPAENSNNKKKEGKK